MKRTAIWNVFVIDLYNTDATLLKTGLWFAGAFCRVFFFLFRGSRADLFEIFAISSFSFPSAHYRYIYR